MYIFQKFKCKFILFQKVSLNFEISEHHAVDLKCDHDKKMKDAYKLCSAHIMMKPFMNMMEEMHDELEEQAMKCITDLGMKSHYDKYCK